MCSRTNLRLFKSKSTIVSEKKESNDSKTQRILSQFYFKSVVLYFGLNTSRKQQEYEQEAFDLIENSFCVTQSNPDENIFFEKIIL